jgi:hypothetical protein
MFFLYLTICPFLDYYVVLYLHHEPLTDFMDYPMLIIENKANISSSREPMASPAIDYQIEEGLQGGLP